jgi:hypothetical protein
MGGEPLEGSANGPEANDVPEELLEELPEQFRQSEVPLDSSAVEASEEEAGEGLEEGFEPEDEIEGEDAEEEELEAAPKGSRAQQRIRKLANERKQLQAAMQQQELQYRQQIQYAQQQAQAMAQQQNAIAEQKAQMLQEQLDMLRSKAEAEEEANLSPMEQYKRQILREAEEQTTKARNAELAELKQMLTAQQQQQQEAREAQQREARYNHYTSMAAKIRNEQLLTGMEDADVSALGPATDEMLLAFSAAYGLEPTEAAPRFQRFLNRYVQADLKRRSQKGAAKVKSSQRVPAGAPAQRAAASTGKGMPSMETLRRNNFNSHIDWMAAGEPPIS